MLRLASGKAHGVRRENLHSLVFLIHPAGWPLRMSKPSG